MDEEIMLYITKEDCRHKGKKNALSYNLMKLDIILSEILVKVRRKRQALGDLTHLCCVGKNRKSLDNIN